MAALLQVTVGTCGAELPEGELYVSVACGGFSASTPGAPGEEAQAVELLVDELLSEESTKCMCIARFDNKGGHFLFTSQPNEIYVFLRTTLK